MGKRDRLRREKIEEGLQASISAKKTVDELGVSLITTKCSEITNFTEIKACQQVEKWLGMPAVPKDVLKKTFVENIPKAFEKLLQSGETKESIYEFYWNISEFRSLWEKLRCTSDELKVSIDSIQGVKETPEKTVEPVQDTQTEFMSASVKMLPTMRNPFVSRDKKRKKLCEMVDGLSDGAFTTYIPQIINIINTKRDVCKEYDDTEAQVVGILKWLPRVKEFSESLYDRVKEERQKYGLKV